MARAFIAAAIVLATVACGRSREIVSTQSASVPTAPSQSTPKNPSVDRARVSGQVSGLAGTCPSIAFTAASVKVTTTTTTAFERSCGDVVNGAFVDVEGTRQADNSIQAERIEVRSHVR